MVLESLLHPNELLAFLELPLETHHLREVLFEYHAVQQTFEISVIRIVVKAHALSTVRVELLQLLWEAVGNV